MVVACQVERVGRRRELASPSPSAQRPPALRSMNIGALPFLQPRVDALLDADRPLQATAAALGKLVDEPLLFSLCLSCLLPPILDPYRPVRIRLFSISLPCGC